MPSKPKLGIVSIHGTFANITSSDSHANDTRSKFFLHNSDFAQALIAELSETYEVVWEQFPWSGKNLESARYSAVKELKKFINNKTHLGKNILLIAHSHGGNIALDWIANYSSKYSSHAITFGTPFTHLEKKKIKNIPALGIAIILLASSLIIKSLENFIKHDEAISLTNLPELAIGICLLLGILGWICTPSIRQFRRNNPVNDKNKIHVICHESDEAVALLQSKTKININLRFLRTPLLFLIAIFVWVGALFSLPKKYIDPFIDTIMGIRNEDIFDRLYLMALSGLTAFLAAIFLSHIVLKFVGNFANYRASVSLNKTLWKLATGQDTKTNLKMHRIPDLNVNSYIQIKEDEELKNVFKKIQANSNKAFSQLKNQTIKGLMSTGGNLMKCLKDDPNLGKGLIHCQYFSKDMAKYLGKYVKTQFNQNQM